MIRLKILGIIIKRFCIKKTKTNKKRQYVIYYGMDERTDGLLFIWCINITK